PFEHVARYFSRATMSLGHLHTREGYLYEGSPITEKVETLGLLPRRSAAERKQLLQESPATAIEYIAAIMSAYALEADKFGVNIRSRPSLLAAKYQGLPLKNEGQELEAWSDQLRTGKKDFSLGNADPSHNAGWWVE